MKYFIIRRSKDKEPLALVRLNVNESSQMTIMKPTTHPRFGPMAQVTRYGRHVFNLMIGDNKEVEEALQKSTGYQLDEVGQAEWETFIAFDLFPVLKLALVK
jgi:hypothetical protein